MDLHMKLGDNGEAFFVEESEEPEVGYEEVLLSVSHVTSWKCRGEVEGSGLECCSSPE